MRVCSMAARAADVSIPRLHRPGPPPVATLPRAGGCLHARRLRLSVPAPPARTMSSPRTYRHAACSCRPRRRNRRPQDGWPGGLPALRAELDRIDDHAPRPADAARARGGACGEVRQARRVPAGARGVDHPPAAAPPRRRACRAQALVRIWRELLAGTTAMQGPFTVAVCEPDAAAGFTQAAREHFGALTPLHVHRSPAQAMAEVSGGSAAVGVLPLPVGDRDAARRLVDRAAAAATNRGIYVVARLPFWTPRAEGAPPCSRW